MKYLYIIKHGLFQIASIIFFIVFLFGGLNIYFSDRNNYCVMTYMFEYPQFVRISVPENALYPQYGLYAYSEGRLTEKARKMWFDGIPVLYLPGNFGSHKQSRSLASVALRKALSNVNDFHFDYFTLDYNEELSGLYGGVLERQTEFAAHCVTKILSLYKSSKYMKVIPSSVILIGHSMGGVIAKRLLAYNQTVSTTIMAISLAAPLEAPVLNFDVKINEFYMKMHREWKLEIETMESKLLLSFGNGARDILMPSGLTGSKDSDINALTTSIPGVWVSPDHVSIVWCKQLVMAINKFLFASVDLKTKQIIPNKPYLLTQAKKFFEANRSSILSPNIKRPNVTMVPDAFWYEDNRLFYQIIRPEIEKMTYLMIRLVTFPQNRFVAIESINLDDKDWLFGCNANNVHGSHRFCQTAMSITELSRWSGAVNNFGKRKLATIHLHQIMDMYPHWTHVIVKVSPTRKPITLNVDINDHASREITVDLPYMLPFTKTIIKEETAKDSLYYELILPELNFLHQTYYLHVEPTASCKAVEYHSTAELHVPWAKNHEYHHYFTHLKQSPMKIRLFKNNPNANDTEATEHAKITLLLDPQCTYTISISPSLYNQVGHLVRSYYALLIPFVAAILVMAARTSFISLRRHGTFVSIHNQVMVEGLKPYYVLVGTRLGNMVLISVPLFAFIFETANTRNEELQYFIRSLLSIPTYMIALGIVNVATAVILVIMVFSSQLAHRLLFRIVWRGGSSLAEKLARGLQKIPTVVSAALVCAVPLSCGAAALAAGAAFYSFMLSKMYEEYLEDYVYRLMAKVGSKFCKYFKSKKTEETEKLIAIDEDKSTNTDNVAIENKQALESIEDSTKDNKDDIDNLDANIDNNKLIVKKVIENESENDQKDEKKDQSKDESKDQSKDESKDKRKDRMSKNVDEQLNGLNFHMSMFLLWLIVMLVNVPALITWARNFKYTMVLQPDTSYYPGIIMSVCAGFLWQIESPRRNLKYYDILQQVLFLLAVSILVLAPLGIYYINYIVTAAFVLITVQQLFDQEVIVDVISEVQAASESTETPEETPSQSVEQPDINRETSSTNCECDESTIYNRFKDVREKIALVDEL